MKRLLIVATLLGWPAAVQAQSLAAPYPWHHFTSTLYAKGGVRHIFSIKASAPIGRGIYFFLPELVIRCLGDSIESARIDIGSSPFLAKQIDVRWSARPVERQTWTIATHRDVAPPDTKAFVDSLMRHRRVALRFYPRKEPPIVVLFQVPEPGDAATDFRQQCGADTTQLPRDPAAEVRNVALVLELDNIHLKSGQPLLSSSLIGRVTNSLGRPISTYAAEYYVVHDPKERPASFSTMTDTIPVFPGRNTVNIVVNGYLVPRIIVVLVDSVAAPPN